MNILERDNNDRNLLKLIPMKRIFFLIIAVISSVSFVMADITVTVPKKWKNKTIYVWQTDINQVFSRQEDEAIHQVKDTLIIKESTFTLPVRLNCATKIDILTPKKDESDFDHTIAEACIMPAEDLHLYLDDNYVRAEGSLLNQQMAEIYTYYMQSLVPYITAYGRGDMNEAARIAREFQQWYVDWIKANPEVPGAAFALYQLSDPQIVVELGDELQGEAKTSLFYPYTENHINRCKKVLQRRKSQTTLSGREAPNFTLTDISGSRVSLSDFRGKWVVLDFWGSWCAPCLKGMPELREIYDFYNGKLEIIGIDCNDAEDDWKNAVSHLQLPWIQLRYTDQDTVTTAYSITVFPTKVVVDPEGIIKKVYPGALPTFKTDIAEWLK